MDLLKIVGVIVTLLGIAFGLYFAVFYINEHCTNKYGYEPISIGRTLAMVIPYALVIVAMMLGGGDNMIAAVVLAGLVTIIVFWHIARHTSFLIALVAMLLIITFGFLIVAALAVVFGLVSESRQKRTVYVRKY